MNRLVLASLAAIAAVAVVGTGFVIFDDRSAPPIVIADPRPDATIVVGVDGAVATPGVYALPGDARAQDALAAAGGAAADADLAALNLARRLRDEDHLLVPRLAPVVAVVDGPSFGSPVSPAFADAPMQQASVVETGPVNLNAASLADLDGLPGIGPVLAQRILDHRTVVGPFRTIDELADVQGISPRMVDDLRALVTAGT